MLFNSFAFLIFLPIVFIIYWGVSYRFRWVFLLLASYYFYMSWSTKYVILIFFTTVISYGAARLLEIESSKRGKKLILVGTAVLCLGILFFFKYYNFFIISVADFLNIFAIRMNPVILELFLPVGISFYTFQTLSYVIDVYKGDVPAEHHFGYYAVFISFFPQLVAGPIERTRNLLPQIKERNNFDYDQATYGLKLMAWGFFKKIVIADTLSKYVSRVYDAPRNFEGFVLVLATLFFALQIYCDFSGYSDIAIGTAKLFGIDLMTNFKSPYFSQSMKEFWSRWHISLSIWFRDYIYIPLGGNRVSKGRYIFNLMITFLASGLWHGANWTFVVWGGIHGIVRATEDFVMPKNKSRSTGIIWWLRVLFVFLLASFAWIFFVSNSIGDAFYVIRCSFTGISSPVLYLQQGLSDIAFGEVEWFMGAVSLIMLALYDYFAIRGDVIETISSKRIVIRWTIYCVFILWVVINIPVNNAPEFIYFQF